MNCDVLMSAAPADDASTVDGNTDKRPMRMASPRFSRSSPFILFIRSGDNTRRVQLPSP